MATTDFATGGASEAGTGSVVGRRLVAAVILGGIVWEAVGS